MYNGVPASEVRSDGARRNTVMALADGLVGRGVLLDISASSGCELPRHGDVVTVVELEAAEAAQPVAVGAGDILLVGLGARSGRRALKPGFGGFSGLHPECLPWLHERSIAVLGSDGISTRCPASGPPVGRFRSTRSASPAIGLHLIDNMALDALASPMRGPSALEFLFAMSFRSGIQRGTGCPVNPIGVL